MANSSNRLIDLNSTSVPIRTLVADVNSLLEDSATRKQIRSRLNKFEESTSIQIDGREAKLTDKGLEQCRLLDHIIQLCIDMEESASTTTVDRSLEFLDDEEAVLSLPQSMTVGELMTLAVNLDHEYDNDTTIELKLVSSERDGPLVEK